MKKIFLFLVVLLLSVSCTIQKTTSKKYIDDAYYTPQTDVNENQIDSLYDNEYVDDNFTNYSFFINPYQYTYSYYDLYYSSYYSPWNFGINFGYYSYNYYPYLYGYNWNHNNWNHNNWNHNNWNHNQNWGKHDKKNYNEQRRTVREINLNNRQNLTGRTTSRSVKNSKYSTTISNYSTPTRSVQRYSAPTRSTQSYSAPTRSTQSYSSPTRSAPPTNSGGSRRR